MREYMKRVYHKGHREGNSQERQREGLTRRRHKGTESEGEESMDPGRERANALSREVIGAAIEVHRHLGPGLLESAYEVALRRELELREIPHQFQVPLPVEYKGVPLDCAYRLDVVVGGILVVELKSVDKLEPIHTAQLLTYLRLSNLWLGLLINFNVPVLREGVRRVVCS
jgi:GxxExxY protein